MSGHGDTRGFDLPIGNPGRLQALEPILAKTDLAPRFATPVMRPRICFRCLTFFGINMMIYSFAISNFRNLVFGLCTKIQNSKSKIP